MPLNQMTQSSRYGKMKQLGSYIVLTRPFYVISYVDMCMVQALHYDESAPISPPHFSSFFTSVHFSSGHLVLSLRLLFVSFVLPSLLSFVDEEWQREHNFILTLFIGDSWIISCSVISEKMERSTSLVDSLSLTHSISGTVLVTWLKPSNDSRGLRLTL